MTWTKLGDEFADEAADLSDAAFRTHVEALLWSNKRLLDLVVPKRDLRRFAFGDSVDVGTPDGDEAVRELVAAGWWTDQLDVWDIGVRWPDWQLDKVQVERARARDTAKKQRQRAHARGDHQLCTRSCRAADAPSSSLDPVPSRVPGARPHGVSPGPVPPGTGRMCHTHPGQTAASCSGCRADRLAGDRATS